MFLLAQIMESTDLVPLDGDVSRITRRGEEFKDLHEALQRNLQTYLTLTLDVIAGVHQKVKSSLVPDATRQMVSSSSSLPFVYINSTADSWKLEKEIKIFDDLCRNIEISHVARRLLVPRAIRRGNRSLKSSLSSIALILYMRYIYCRSYRTVCCYNVIPLFKNCDS
jgi:hypothetical protein